MHLCKRILPLLCILTLTYGCKANIENSPSIQHLARDDGSLIHYYLDRSTTRGQQPILLLLQGSDCNSASRINHIAKYAGLSPQAALLRIEKYGITSRLEYDLDESREDCPKDYLLHNSIHRRVSDVVAVLAEARNTASWWNGRLIIVGGSSGALVATAAAELIPETESVVIFGYGSRWFEQDLTHNLRDAPERSEVLAMFRSMQLSPVKDRFASGHSHYYWAEMLEFDQLAALSKLQIPVLALQGGNDQSVSPEGARALVRELHQLGKSNVHHKEFENLDHSFRDTEGNPRLDEVLEYAREWLSGI